MYKAPLKELRFVMHHLLGDQQLAGLPGLEEYSGDFTDSVLDEAGKFAEIAIQPRSVRNGGWGTGNRERGT